MMRTPTPFDGYANKNARVSSTCLVTFAKNRYSVPCELAGQQVSLRVYPTKVCIAANEQIVASQVRLRDAAKEQEVSYA